MSKEEYQKYLEDMKSKLTNKDKISLQKEYDKLKTKLFYWLKRSNNVIVLSESDCYQLKYAESRYSEISSRIEELEYLLS